MKKERVFYLDFIRALSVLAIVIFHFNTSIGSHRVALDAKPILLYEYMNGNLGQIGVSLFFIISGAALMYSYSDDFSLVKFYKKRWLSIFPMFYLSYFSVQMYYFLRYHSLNPFGVGREPWTIILTFLGLDGYLSSIIPNFYFLGEWFLGCIIIMYLLYPLIKKIFQKISPLLFFIIMCGVYILIVSTYTFAFPIELFVFTRIIEFIFGMLFIYYFKRIKNSFILIPASVIFFVWIFYFIDINQMYKTTIMGVVLFIILACVGQNISSKWFEKPVFLVSKYSYAIFLIHHVVMEQLCSFFEDAALSRIEVYYLLFSTFILVGVFAYIIYNANELILKKIKYLKIYNKGYGTKHE